MKYVYTALLLHSSQKPINEENVTNILKAAGVKVEEARVKSLVASLSEVNIDEALKAASVSAQASAPAQEAAKPAKKEKEEKPEEEEKKDEEALAGLGALFG